MYITYDDTKIFFRVKGEKSQQTLMFLHGWGCDNGLFEDIVNSLGAYRCVIVDFPPFGKSESPKRAWTLDDYVNVLKAVLKQLNTQKLCLIGHSFGGRVAIRLAGCYNKVCKLILVGSAGLKSRKSVCYYVRVWFFKIFKKYLNPNKHGSEDYKKLSPLMKQTFVNIINTDLAKDCKKISAPTLLIYGKNDKETPISMAKKFAVLLPNSTLKIYPNSGHYCFLEKSEMFFDDVITFLRGK